MSFKHPTTDELDALFDAHALEVGRLANTWNHLHESLANLFWHTTGIKDRAVAFAIWHSTPSDLSQRKMLRAGAEVAFPNFSAAREEIIWLLDKVDHLLSHKRNNAIHAPIEIVYDIDGTRIRPHDWTGNPRSAGLKEKAILEEIAWYRDTAWVLHWYAAALSQSFDAWDSSLPDRPALPPRGHSNSAMDTPPATRPKVQRLRPQA